MTGLVKRHVYVAEVFGSGWTKAAHMITAHGRSGDLTFVSKRRVMPLDPVTGGPLPFPLLIRIDVHEYKLL